MMPTRYRDSGDIGRSIPAVREAIRLDNDHADARATLCTDLVPSDRPDEAREVARQILDLDPEFRIAEFSGRHPYSNKATLAELARVLREVGLPE
jgi:hypothetical protein